MKLTRVRLQKANGYGQLRGIDDRWIVQAWDNILDREWEDVAFNDVKPCNAFRTRADAVTAAAAWESEHPHAPLTGRLSVQISYPCWVGSITNEPPYDDFEEVANFRNSPAGWDKARTCRSDRFRSYRESHGEAACGPRSRIVIA